VLAEIARHQELTVAPALGGSIAKNNLPVREGAVPTQPIRAQLKVLLDHMDAAGCRNVDYSTATTSI
jgi:hypothetical protein